VESAKAAKILRGNVKKFTMNGNHKMSYLLLSLSRAKSAVIFSRSGLTFSFFLPIKNDINPDGFQQVQKL